MLKENWFKYAIIVLVILNLIVLFQTCNLQEYRPIIIFPDSTDKAIEKKLDSLLKKEYVIENNITNNKKYYQNEINNFPLLPDSVKRSRIMQMSRDILKD